MSLVNKEIRRGDDADLVFTVSGDITADAISFVCKRDKTLTSARVIQKRNTVAGGSNDELEISYADGISTITVHLLEVNTQLLTDDFLYFDIYNSGDNETAIHGKMWLLYDVQSPYDGALLPDVTIPILGKSIYLIINDGVIVTENYYGFTVDPVATVGQTESFDQLYITSSTDELESAGIPSSNNQDWNTIDFTTGLLTVSWDLGKFNNKIISFVWEYYSNT